MTLLNSIVLLSTLTLSILSSATQSQEYIKTIWPSNQVEIITATKKDIYYTGQGSTKNYYAHFSFPKNLKAKTLLIITGLEDPVPLWFDTVLKAKEHGFKNVYIIELRGQGQSERVPGNTKNLIHVESFENYYLDLISALRDIDNRSGFNNTVKIISHSTGSLVLGNSLERIKEELPNINMTAIAFWTPLISLKLSPLINNPIVRPIISIIEKIYSACCGAMIAKKYIKKDFQENTLTTDPKKFKAYQSLCFDHKLGSSGVSIRWVLESIKASQMFQNQHLNNISIPTIILKAENDLIVENAFSYQNKNISEVTITGAKHALNIEKNSVFDESIRQTFLFFDKN